MFEFFRNIKRSFENYRVYSILHRQGLLSKKYTFMEIYKKIKSVGGVL